MLGIRCYFACPTYRTPTFVHFHFGRKNVSVRADDDNLSHALRVISCEDERRDAAVAPADQRKFLEAQSLHETVGDRRIALEETIRKRAVRWSGFSVARGVPRHHGYLLLVEILDLRLEVRPDCA